MMNKVKLLGYVVILALLLWLMPAVAYADGGGGLDGGFTVVEDDNTPPARVTDMAVISRSDTSLTLAWTAPGDDGLSGTASQYNIRYSTSVIDAEAAWDAATVVSAPPTPQAADSGETFTVTGLSSGTRYYFALKTADEVPNWSDLSNSPLGITSDTTALPQFSLEPEYQEFAGQTPLVGSIDASGVVTNPVTAESFDKLLTLTLDKGTAALTRYGVPLGWVGMYNLKSIPAPPEAAYIVSLMYELQPSGATFDPPIILTYSYDPGHLPEGVDGEDLVVSHYDASIGEWTNFNTVVDTENNIITVQISHFSPIAMFVYRPVASSPVFEYSALEVSPSQVGTGEAVTINILAANTGDKLGQCVVTLKMNDRVEVTKKVTLAAGTSKPISFTTTKNTAGSYSVVVNGLTGSFVVKEKKGLPVVHAEPLLPAGPIVPSATIPVNWYLIGGIILALVVVSLVSFLLVRRRAH